MNPTVTLRFVDSGEDWSHSEKAGLDAHNWRPAAYVLATLSGSEVEAIKTETLGRSKGAKSA